MGLKYRKMSFFLFLLFALLFFFTTCTTTKTADFSKNRMADRFSGAVFHKEVHSQHAAITDSCLLSFIHEEPQTEENTVNPESQEEYRRVLFRVQQTTNSLVKQHPKGIVAIRQSSPKALVMNTGFHGFLNYDVEEVENYVIFIQTDNLPEFAPGDFLLDHEMGVVKKVVSVVEDNGMIIVLETEEADMQEALGSVIVDFDDNPLLTAETGFKTYPGIAIACILGPQMEIPFALQAEYKDTHTTLDFITEGEMEMALDVKFYKHTFKFGRVFKYSKELYGSTEKTFFLRLLPKKMSPLLLFGSTHRCSPT
ncbi:MAG: hypothetical protein ACLFQE_06185, partial [Thermotogota bacterium]